MSGSSLFPVLLHYPVEDKDGNEISAAVTNLDLHDLARIAVTYGTRDVWIVTPIPEQQQLVRDIVEHWTRGAGSRHNPDRKSALSKIRLAASLEEVKQTLCANSSSPVFTVFTSARKTDSELTFGSLRRLLEQQAGHYLLLFGTAHGISRRLRRQVDYQLEPIQAGGSYNHLPVRAAVAITIDRLLGR